VPIFGFSQAMLSGSGTGYLSLSTAKASHAVIQRKACSLSAADLSVKARDAYLSIATKARRAA
jgi:hypothetical protein